MALERDVYRGLENIVGWENISNEPVILDSYTFCWLSETHPQFAPSKYGIRPEAVLLPANTEEVQAIVKVCNRYKIKYKAHATGYGVFAFPYQEGVVLLDLRRMNRILEIDEQNKFAVVEPYVTWAELNAEAMKKGLFSTGIQGGSQTSVLANVTSMWGVNTMGNHGGHNGRNMLGVEWILPTGELLKLGPPNEWFCCDGPGPGLRGIFRGQLGAMGGLGVFTKCAIKLHNWPGPSSVLTEPVPAEEMALGVAYRLKKPLNFSEFYAISFPDYNKMVDFMYKVGDAEIGYSIIRCGDGEHFLHMLGGAMSNKTMVGHHESGMIDLLRAAITHAVVVTLFCNSQGEFEYQKKVLEKLIEESGGTVPMKEMGEGMEKYFIDKYPVVLFGNDTHFTHHSGGFILASSYTATCEAVFKYHAPKFERLRKKYVKKGVILDDGIDTVYYNAFENNAYNYVETEFHYDPADPKSVMGSLELGEEMWKTTREDKFPIESSDVMLAFGGSTTPPQERVLQIGRLCKDYHIWQERIKQAFDPNDVSDRSSYGAGFLVKGALKGDIEKEV
jgi:glycolate oxidase